MADSSVLREFLVSLGYKVDTSSEAKFKDSVKAASDQIKTFGTALAGAATVVNIGIMRMANDLNDLYLASGRTKASADNIKTMEYAVGQLGGTAEGARGSLEALAANLRNRPGYNNMLQDLGVQTKDANGNLRDSVDLLADLGDALKDKPYYQQNAYASSLGIDERTLMAITKPEFRAQMQAYREMLKAAGVDQGEAAEKANEFSRKSSELWAGVKVAMAGVTGVITQDLIPVLDVANSALKSMLEWFRDLDPGTKNVARNIGEIGLVFGTILATIKSATIAMGLLKSAAGLASGGAAAGAAGGAGAAAGAGAAGGAAAAGGAGLLAGGAWTAAAGWAGWEAGSEIYKHLPDQTKDAIGGTVATVLAKFGSKDAQRALDANLRSETADHPYGKKPEKPAPAPAAGDAVMTALGNLIAKGESGKAGYNAYNKGTVGKKVIGADKVVDFSSMTLEEVMRRQKLKIGDAERLFAVGKYQVIPSTLASAAKHMGLSGKEKFTPELQEKIFTEALLPKSVRDYISRKSNDLNRALIDMSKQWRSVADPRTGATYGDAGAGPNKASTLASIMANAIIRARENSDILSKQKAVVPKVVFTQQPYQALGDRPTTINQTNNLTINGITNPSEMERSVGNAQRDTNAELARNFRTSAR